MNSGEGLNGVNCLIIESTVVYAKTVIAVPFSGHDDGGAEG